MGHNYPTVLCHGLVGIDYGEYNYINYIYRYFGGFRGDVVKAMRKKGHEFYDPGMGPCSPVWDRVCDMYAYLVGGTVDYGVAHAKKYNHARFGRTYPGVLKDWGEPGDHEKINLLGYSFGGPTVNLLNGLLINGSKEEMEATPADEISPLFTGGKGDLLHCVCTLDGTNNGTAAIEFAGRPVVDAINRLVNDATIMLGDTVATKVLDMKMDQFGFHAVPGKETGKFRSPMAMRDENVAQTKSKENMWYQMSIEYSKYLADKYYDTNPNTYYLCYRSCRTHETDSGNQLPNVNMNVFMKPTAAILGSYTNASYGIDDKWLPNDGIVGLAGQSAPYNQPCAGDFRVADETKPGTWYHMPIIDGDHLTWCGWFINKRAYEKRFEDIIKLCNSLD